MLKPYCSIVGYSIALAIIPQAAFGLSSSWIAQLPTLQPPPPPVGSLKGSSDDVPLCYIRLSGSTVNLHQLCGMAPNQAPSNTPITGNPNQSNRSNTPLSSTQGSNRRAPVSFGTGSAYADDR